MSLTDNNQAKAKTKQEVIPPQKGQHGGPRKGGGRPFGSENILHRVRVKELVSEGKAPINIMLGRMWFWDEKANLLAAQLSIDSASLRQMDDGPEKIEAINKLSEKLDMFFEADDRAFKCAIETAPYCHARLQSVKVDVTNNITPQKIAHDAPEEKFIEGYANLVKESYNVQEPDPVMAAENGAEE